jgi:nicotinate-nucleotide pyrophosphorylase (carboxylating)
MEASETLLRLALQEDIGPGDITTENLIDADRSGTATIIAREPLVLAGLATAVAVFRRLDPGVAARAVFRDGARVPADSAVLRLEGRLAPLLMAERTALNFLQRLSGIASRVRTYVEGLGADGPRLVDTRKTTPGWRTLEKYAVRVGGGHNHRMGLFDGVLIKDNHIAACGGIRAAVERIRPKISHLLKIEVEVSNMHEVHEALAAGVDVIMLDNMQPEQIRQAAALIDGRALIEVSGRVAADDLKVLSSIAVDFISVGALTHSAPSVDLSMEIHPSPD